MSQESELLVLIRKLYHDLGQATGGPLHVELDDMNLCDEDLTPQHDRYNYLFDGRFDAYAYAGDDVSYSRKQAIQDVCERILALLRPMSEPERRAVVRQFWEEGKP